MPARFTPGGDAGRGRLIPARPGGCAKLFLGGRNGRFVWEMYEKLYLFGEFMKNVWRETYQFTQCIGFILVICQHFVYHLVYQLNNQQWWAVSKVDLLERCQMWIVRTIFTGRFNQIFCDDAFKDCLVSRVDDLALPKAWIYQERLWTAVNHSQASSSQLLTTLMTTTWC